MPILQATFPFELSWSLKLNGTRYLLELQKGDALGILESVDGFSFLNFFQVILTAANNNGSIVKSVDPGAIGGICDSIKQFLLNHDNTVLYYISRNSGFDDMSSIWSRWGSAVNDIECNSCTRFNLGSTSVTVGCFLRSNQRLKKAIVSHFEAIPGFFNQ